MHVNSLGYHEVYINGIKVGNHVLSPAVSQQNKRSLVVTYDVTSYVHKGHNELVIWLGQGWYKTTTFGTNHDGPVVKAEMNVRINKQWELILSTNHTWTGRESGYSDTGTWQALRFGGERIDKRIVPANLTISELNKLKWFPVTTITVPSHQVSPQMCESNTIQATLTPQSIEALNDSTWMIDMGKVLTGWFELQISQLPAGHKISVMYTDDLNKDPDVKKQGENDI